MRKINEWFIDAPWGKIALVSWGEPSGEPVLLVHGRQDSAATFIPLLEYLPASYYYVAVDLPGHGLSEPMPVGVMLTRFHLLAGVEYAVKHLNWERFIYIGHSMGSELGLFYNAIYPKKITKMVLLDPIPALQRLQIHDFSKYYKMFHQEYYSNYRRYNKDDRVYTKRQALDAVMRARGLTEELAELVLSRNLWPVGDKYRLSWDRRLKTPAASNFPPQYYCELFSATTPMLVVSANRHSPALGGREIVEMILAKMKAKNENFFVETAEGGHDVHLTNPKSVAGFVVDFLKNQGRAKL